MNFAQSLYISEGRNVYEFVRLNFSEELPSLSPLNDNLRKGGMLIDHRKSSGCQTAVCSEDRAGIIKKITHNAVTNISTGFSVPLEHGLPSARHFQTNSFDSLKSWFETKDKSCYLNIIYGSALV